jgi:parallel beta-helix repeat protein
MNHDIIQVSTPAELLQALQAATGGETIGLAAAGDWSRIDLGTKISAELDFDSEVVIRSADLEQRASVGELLVRGASNITFESLDFDYTFSPGDDWRLTPFQIRDSTAITIRDSLFDGDAGYTGNPATDGYPTAHGLRVHNSTGVILEDNEITGWARGMKLHDSADIVVRNNDFHHQRMDHMVVSQMAGLVIENNLFRDHVAAPDSADHRDMIQMWSDGTTQPTTDVAIRGNVFKLNDAEWGSQSLFLQNRAVDRDGAGDEMFYRNFVITDNVIVNGHKHGIKLGSIDGVHIANNTILRGAVSDGDGILQTPLIDIEPGSRNVTVVRNVMSELRGHEGQSDWTVADNVLVQDRDQRQANHYSDMFINPSLGTRSDLPNLQTLPGSEIAALGAGAAMLAYQDTPETLTALIHGTRDAGDWTSFTFDASYSAGPGGRLSPGTASYHWDFGDGTTAEGMTVTHDYSPDAGYTVTLTVTDSDGGRDVNTARIEIGQPEVVRFEGGTDGLVLADGTVMALPDDMLSQVGESLTFRGAETRHVIDKDVLSNLPGARNIGLEVTLKSDDWSTGAGEVMRLHKGFVLSVTEEGHARIVYYPDAGPRVILTSETALADGTWGRIGISADAGTGTLRIMIDGQPAGEAAIDGGLSVDLAADLSLGSAWSGNGFTGEIAQLRLAADETGYAPQQNQPEAGTPDPAPADPADPADPAPDHWTPVQDSQIVLHGDATVEQAGRIRLDGDGDWIEVGGAARETIFADGPVRIEIGYQRAVADGGPAKLAWLHQRLGLEAVGDGLAVRVRTADGGMERFMIEGLGLDTTARHSIRLEVDDDADRLELAVNDEIVFRHDDTDLRLDDPGLTKVWDWRLGGAWNGWLDGVIDDFRVSTVAGPPEAAAADDALFAPLITDPLAEGALVQDLPGV